MADSFQSSFNSSSSSSGSFIPDYPQSGFLMQVAQLAQQYGQQTMGWALNQFAKTDALTDKAIDNYVTASTKAMELANGELDRYQNVFQPQEDALIRDANTYASGDRIRQDMGAAESGQEQASNAARIQAEQQLESYGIDPSSGRYAALDRVARTQGGAAAAGAADVARRSAEATGRGLRQQAIQIGQMKPANVINSLNQYAQDVQGAVNADLARDQVGTQLHQAANPYLNTASSLKYPPLGQKSQSQSSGSSQGQSRGDSGSKGDKSGSDRSGGGGDPGDGSGGRGRMSPAQEAAALGYGGFGKGGGGYTHPKIMNLDKLGITKEGGEPGGDISYAQLQGIDDGVGGKYDWQIGTDAMMGPNGIPITDTDAGVDAWNQGFGDVGEDYYDYGQGTGGDYFSGGEDDQSYYDNFDPTADWNYDPNAESGDNYYGDQSGYGYDDPNASGDYGFDPSQSYDYSDPNASGDYGFDPSQSYDYGGGDNTAYDTSYNDQSYDTGGDYFSGGGDYDYSSYGDFGGDYARGGPVRRAPAARRPSVSRGAIPTSPDATTGGFVPRSLSPSQGRQTDDIPANLNAGEFVLPKDVVKWKGEEYFQKLIQQARKARVGAPGKATQGKPAQGPSRFQSRPMR